MRVGKGGFIRCALCGRNFKINPKKSINEETKRLGMAKITIKRDGYNGGAYICKECFHKFIWDNYFVE